MTWTERAQRIDNRILYIALAVAVAIPVFVKMHPAIPASSETMGAYNAIEQMPPGKIVMIHSTWDAGTIGECQGQCHAIVEHLMRKGIPFVIWTNNAASPQFYRDIIGPIAAKYHRVYGVDWVDFGLKSVGAPLSFSIQAMARDFPGYMRFDVRNTPADQIPMLRGVKDASSFGLLVSIGYNPTGEFIQFVQAIYGTRVVFAIAAINATTTYTYLDSKQIVGMLVGARGGAEYEMKLNDPGMGVKIIVAQSFGHVLIILVVLLGNIGYFAGRLSRKNESAA